MMPSDVIFIGLCGVALFGILALAEAIRTTGLAGVRNR